MSPGAALHYVGGALGYALAGMILALTLMGLFGSRPDWRSGGLCVAVLFPVFLGLHPFPDPAALDCSKGDIKPMLQPFGFLDAYARFWREGRPLSDWLTSRAIMPPIMNVLLFAPAGAALALMTGRAGLAVLLAFGLTGFIETAQITGLFGVYPCPYRYFEVDDMILNTTGVMLGYALVRLVRRG